MADEAAYQANSLETISELGDTPAATVQYWLAQIDLAEKELADWKKRGKRVVERYRDDRRTAPSKRGQSRFNILWANVETLKPVLYAKSPKPDVSARWKDSDEGVPRLAAQILERSLSYIVDCQDFDGVMKGAVEDRLLPGLGAARVRYVPTFGGRIQELAENPDTEAEPDDDVPGEREVVSEKASIDYVHWQEILWSPARRWEEVSWVAFRSYLTRDELKERFGDEKGKAVVLDYSPAGVNSADKDKNPDLFKKAVVWEIWDRAKKQVVWLATGYPSAPLDTLDDPLELEGFFPCPKPLFSTTTTDKTTPVPDYTEYQDQARELDVLTARIEALTRVLRLAGIYPGEDKFNITQLVAENAENKLIPVEDWAAVNAKGGLEGMILWLPIETVIKVLEGLYKAREIAKQTLYEVTGLSDIMRGSTNANETATAQQLKSQYGSIRVQDSQKDVARFARDLFRMAAELMSNHFSPQTFTAITGLPELPKEVPAPPPPDQMMVQRAQAGDPQARQMAQQYQQAVQKRQAWEAEVQKKQAEFGQACELLKNDALRNYRVDIETDSTIAADEQAEKQARTEFITALGSFLQSAGPIVQQAPQTGPLIAESIKFLAAGFRSGRPLMDSIDQFAETLKNIPPPAEKTDPELEKVKADIALKEKQFQFDSQLEMQKFQGEQQLAQQRLQNEKEMGVLKMQSEHALQRERMAGDAALERERMAREPTKEAA